MEGWSDGFSQAIEQMIRDVESFLADVAEDLNEMIDGLAEVTEDLADQFQQMTVQVEEGLSTLVDPILEAYLGFEITVENSIQPITHTVDPILNNHSACVGCRNYHGHSYNGTVLICAMHPYGWEDEQCPDWESTWKK